ncbi:MAG: DUF2752 domain-containing protein [Myxococcales bacterium]|nr:DUF2752 domain-containing protein [Myxococcales bacterium]
MRALREYLGQQHGLAARLGSALLALGISAVFVLAALLEPSPVGHGTHTQLGLGSCSFLTLVGVPCPMCGATTSFTLMAHLQPIAAVLNQPFASLLFLLAAAVLGVAVAEVVDPRDRWSKLGSRVGPYEGWLALAFLVLMGLGWAYKVWLMAAAT